MIPFGGPDNTPDGFQRWVRKAHPGAAYIYHSGFLMRDRQQRAVFGQSVIHSAGGPVHDIAKAAWRASQVGLVYLLQHKVEHGIYLYYAFRSRRRA